MKCSVSQCSVSEVVRRRKGVIADVSIPEDELVIEYTVRAYSYMGNSLLITISL